jgi:hypothetical protein
MKLPWAKGTANWALLLMLSFKPIQHISNVWAANYNEKA